MKLTELHLREYARCDGTMHQTFREDGGWDMELRSDLGGVILSRKNRDKPEGKRDQMWIPLSNIRNGTPTEVPGKGK